MNTYQLLIIGESPVFFNRPLYVGARADGQKEGSSDAPTPRAHAGKARRSLSNPNQIDFFPRLQ
jgi:hypothetical protein